MKDNWDKAEKILLYVGLVSIILATLVYIVKLLKRKDDTTVLSGSNIPRNYVAMSDGRAPQSVTITFVPVDLSADSQHPRQGGRVLGSSGRAAGNEAAQAA